MTSLKPAQTLLVIVAAALLSPGTTYSAQESRVIVRSGEWELVGDLVIADAETRQPAVLMLNQAAGDRQPYKRLAAALAKRGIASLRLDLRGHGESTNPGEFQPEGATAQDRETFIWNADADVVAAHRFLLAHPAIHPGHIGIVGASYSGEEMAEAGRDTNYAAAYVVLSPGSFSDESIADMDASQVPWLFIVSRKEQFLVEISAKVQALTEEAELVYLPGDKHATDLLESRPDLAERIAVWFLHALD